MDGVFNITCDNIAQNDNANICRNTFSDYPETFFGWM